MKKAKGNIIILALVLVNVILTAINMFTMMPAQKKTAKLVDKICEIVDLNVGDDPQENEDEITLEDLSIVPVTFTSKDDTNKATEIVATLGDTVGLVKISVNLNVNTKSEDYDKYSDSFETNMPLIDSAILDVVQQYTLKTVSKSALETGMLAELNKLFSSDDLIYSVTLSQYVVQS